MPDKLPRRSGHLPRFPRETGQLHLSNGRKILRYNILHAPTIGLTASKYKVLTPYCSYHAEFKNYVCVCACVWLFSSLHLCILIPKIRNLSDIEENSRMRVWEGKLSSSFSAEIQ